MKVKYRMTPFARFLIFMLFFAPVAYIGYTFYKGENGFEKIKNIFNPSQDTEADTKQVSGDLFGISNEDTKEEIKRLKKENSRLKTENNALKKQIELLKNR